MKYRGRKAFGGPKSKIRPSDDDRTVFWKALPRDHPRLPFRSSVFSGMGMHMVRIRRIMPADICIVEKTKDPVMAARFLSEAVSVFIIRQAAPSVKKKAPHTARMRG